MRIKKINLDDKMLYKVMKHKMVKKLKAMKVMLDKNKYVEKSKLKEDFEASISQVWESLGDLKQDNLGDLYTLNKFLIAEVVNIHENEENLVNGKLMKKLKQNIQRDGPKISGTGGLYLNM